MRPVHTFQVLPSLPAPLQPLTEIAKNLRWAWDHDAIELFRRLDDDLWKSTNHNPVECSGQSTRGSWNPLRTMTAFWRTWSGWPRTSGDI